MVTFPEIQLNRFKNFSQIVGVLFIVLISFLALKMINRAVSGACLRQPPIKQTDPGD